MANLDMNQPTKHSLKDLLVEHMNANGITPRYICINRDFLNNNGNVPVWLVEDEDIVCSGVPLVWDNFEIFRMSTLHTVDEWLEDIYGGMKVNFNVNYFQPKLFASIQY